MTQTVSLEKAIQACQQGAEFEENGEKEKALEVILFINTK